MTDVAVKPSGGQSTVMLSAVIGLSCAILGISAGGVARQGPIQDAADKAAASAAATEAKLLDMEATLAAMTATLAELKAGQMPITAIESGVATIQSEHDTPHIVIPGVAPASGTTTKLVLAQDVDWPPYAYFSTPPEGDYDVAGFGHDIAKGLTSVCPNLEVHTVQTSWSNCWNAGAMARAWSMARPWVA